MARRPVPPSPSPRAGAAQAAPAKGRRARTSVGSARGAAPASGRRRDVDVREWTSGIRLSGFAVIMLSLVILGTWVLVPTLGTYLEQRQRIAALEESVQLTKEEIAALEHQQERWEDPAYITAQARERLYYVRPGEVVYLIDNDLEPTDLPRAQTPVSDEIAERPSDWMPQLLRSIVGAGLAQSAVEAPAG
ncbi:MULTISPECIES: FtsB family cell division protein [Microbacterium]|uniref:FtsB family cell division protein n=1 Tax=Microbacterium TaxID=33882 RepID=UPI00217D123D|nr:MULTISPECIES: septum formation initiator family protein [Microbacterium]UWF78053.1 septum formation initiator family protein [Microbacterium neungamense]WCM56231.1 septum formation initiator family protein [Microbacterium sp. EF45047]